MASAAVVLLALGLFAVPAAAQTGRREALVVGNGAYGAIGTLPNPGNDAADVSAALRRLGFDVATVGDVDLAGMNEALRLFARDSAGADVALVSLSEIDCQNRFSCSTRASVDALAATVTFPEPDVERYHRGRGHWEVLPSEAEWEYAARLPARPLPGEREYSERSEGLIPSPSRIGRIGLNPPTPLSGEPPELHLRV